MATTTNYGLYVTGDSSEKYIDMRRALYGDTDSNMVKIDTALAGLKSRTVSVVLYADRWTTTDGVTTQEVAIEGITSSTNGILVPARQLTEDQRNAVLDAFVDIYDQSDGIVVVCAYDTVPTIDIPVTIILWG